MKYLRSFILSLLLLLAYSCKVKSPEYVRTPVIQMDFSSFYQDGVYLDIQSINADAVYGLALKTGEEEPSAEDVVRNGVKADGNKLFIGRLEKETDYNIYGVGVIDIPSQGMTYGKVVALTLTTPSLYSWEASRTGLLTFADMDLLPGGVSNKTPDEWNEDRLKPHITFTDSDGQEKWLHEAFLFIGGVDDSRGTILCIPDGKEKSAGRDSWEDFAQWWLDDHRVIDILDKSIGDAIARIGQPSFRHKVIMTMPDPIMLEYFSDKTSSTTYWGEAFGRRLDFANTSDQVLAYRWYIDYVRELWDKAAPKHIELAGFYVLSEILVAKPSGWNYKYKRWDKILPEVSRYLHEMKYGLYWIPYYQADGFDMTSELGIDYTWLQPNKYWDYPEKKQKKSWKWVFSSMASYGHGMEIEFEGSHGEAGWSQWEEGVPRTSSSILETVRTGNDAQGTVKGKPNPQASRNKALLREYMNEFKIAGYYGKARIATYSGTNAMYELATSPDEKDRQMYLEYCRFIAENPLRQ